MRSHEPLDYRNEDVEEPKTVNELVRTPAVSSIAAFALLTVVGLTGGVAIVVAGMVGGLACACMLYGPGDETVELFGIEVGTPGEWGLLADEEVSENE